jgi:adenylyltransferase/sulfurtransferase
MRLAEVGPSGQKRLESARCLVVGAGGLGAPALLYLAAAGIGKLGVCDGDVLEMSNLHRQPIYSIEDLGKSKALLATNRLQKLNPQIEINAHTHHLKAENAEQLFSAYDLVLDCTDNFQTKFLINDAAHLLQKPVVRASIYQFEGQIQTYLPERRDACLRCLWEKTPREGCVGTCQQVGVLGPVPGYFGVLQAMEAIKYFLKLETLKAHEILFSDLVGYTQQKITFERSEDCPLCGSCPGITELVDQDTWEVAGEEAARLEMIFVDIREKIETLADPYGREGCVLMPMSEFDREGLDPTKHYALFCQRGKRSASLVSNLRGNGWQNVYSVEGGIESLRCLW